MKNQARFFFSVARCEFTVQISWRVNQPFYFTSEVFIVQTSDSDYVLLYHILVIILQFFTE